MNSFTTITAHALLEQSRTAAEHIVKKWIRRVFAETSLQILRQQWKIHDDTSDSSTIAATTMTLEISNDMLQHCHRVCERLAVNWGTRLRQGGQEQVATWVQEVAAIGQFWQEEQEQPQILRANNGTNQEEKDDTATSTNNQHLAEAEDEFATEAPPSEEDEEGGPFSEVQLPLAKLRQLYRNDNLNQDLEYWNTTLDKLADSSKQNTSWPLDWDSTVQDYCQRQLVPRLHTKRNQKVQYEVVPRELLEQGQAEDEAHNAPVDDLMGSQRMRLLLKRKRKAAASNTPEYQEEQQQREIAAAQKKRKRAGDGISDKEKEEARLPSDHPEHVIWDWQAEKKALANETEQLEANMIHSDTDPEPPNTVLAALRTVGETHFYLSPYHVEWSDKQRHRAKRAAKKQRLGSTVSVLRNEKKAPMTRVMRSRNSYGKYYLELDAGQCLLQLENGKLHAFSSLEISLLDEDAIDEE